jgi:hypothetical protein
MEMILATEMALAPSVLPTDPPTPTLNPLFASPTPDQTVQALLAQAVPPSPAPRSTEAPAVPSPPAVDTSETVNPPAETAAEATGEGSLLMVLRGGLLVALVAMLLMLLVQRRRQNHTQHHDA